MEQGFVVHFLGGLMCGFLISTAAMFAGYWMAGRYKP
jgi:hypothetical protein